MITVGYKQVQILLCVMFCNENFHTARGGGGKAVKGYKEQTRDYKNPNYSVSNAMGILQSATKLVNFSGNSSRHTLASD